MAAVAHREISFYVKQKCSHHGKAAWRLYVAATHDFSHLIKKVEFYNPGSLLTSPQDVCSHPTIVVSKGIHFSRYETVQRSANQRYMVIKIVCHDGLTAEVKQEISLDTDRRDFFSRVVLGPRTCRGSQHTPKPVPSGLTYGIELELSDDEGNERKTIAKVIQRHAEVDVAVIREYRDAHKPISTWKMVHDGSILCHRYSPHCSKFELVSPILSGEKDLAECYDILKALDASSRTNISVNKSMGFHVHVSIAGRKLPEIKNICLNFVKFEDAMDSFMTPSRRTGGSASIEYCKSCKSAITNPSGTIAKLNVWRHRAIEGCSSIGELCDKMNPEGRYYKLNLQNLATGRQKTIEFRQHAATANPEKVLAWVRFCVAFVYNSARGTTPKIRSESFGAEEQFDELFNDVIKDPVLKRFYKKRRKELARAQPETIREPGARESCCHGCSHGGSCAGRR